MSLADDCQALIEALRKISSPFACVTVTGAVRERDSEFTWTETYTVVDGAIVGRYSSTVIRGDSIHVFKSDRAAAVDMARALLDAPKAGKDHS